MPYWTDEETTAMAWFLLSEGTVGVHKITKTGTVVPIIRMYNFDRSLVDYASARLGTKPDIVKQRSKRLGIFVTVYSARATGTRATVATLRMWPKMPEGARKQRFRDWMLREAVPRTLKAISLPHVAVRLPTLLGLTATIVGGSIQTWLALDRDKPVEPWLRAEREASRHELEMKLGVND